MKIKIVKINNLNNPTGNLKYIIFFFTLGMEKLRSQAEW